VQRGEGSLADDWLKEEHLNFCYQNIGLVIPVFHHHFMAYPFKAQKYAREIVK
jgi:hypothetical protein